MTSMVTQLSGAVTENMAYFYDFDDRLIKVENSASWPIVKGKYGTYDTFLGPEAGAIRDSATPCKEAISSLE